MNQGKRGRKRESKVAYSLQENLREDSQFFTQHSGEEAGGFP